MRIATVCTLAFAICGERLSAEEKKEEKISHPLRHMEDALPTDFTERCRVSELRMQPEAKFPNIALYLEEVKYVIEDLLRDWTCLVELAAGSGGPLVTDKSSHVEDDVRNAVLGMKSKSFMSVGKCPRIVVIEEPTETERKLLMQVQRLRFLCKGTVTVFPFPRLNCELRRHLQAPRLNAADMLQVLSPYFNHVSSLEPQWLLDTDHGQKFARCAIIVMLFSNSHGDFAWHLWDAENAGGQWAFAGGDVNRVADRTLLGTGAREWDEEVLGFPFATVRDASVEPCVLPFIAGVSARYPVQPYIYCRAKPCFFEATQGNRFGFELPADAVTKRSTPLELEMLHKDPSVKYVEHEWGTWAMIGPQQSLIVSELGGSGSGPRETKVRRENPIALRAHWRTVEERVLGRAKVLPAATSDVSGLRPKLALRSRNSARAADLEAERAAAAASSGLFAVREQP